MTKLEFLSRLQKRLAGLPERELQERLNFYSEMIDDRIEDGCTEEEAILKIGTVEEVASQIVADIPLAKIARERLKPKKRLATWELLLLILGSPIWLSLGVAALAVMLSLYVVLWSLVVSAWAVFASFVACALGGLLGGVAIASAGHPTVGIALIGAGLVLAGLSVFGFFGCNGATRGIAILTRRIALGIKKCFVKKEDAE